MAKENPKILDNPSDLEVERKLKSIERATNIQEGFDAEEALRGIEGATKAEENERKKRGLTLEPEAKRIRNEKWVETKIVEPENLNNLSQNDLEKKQAFLTEFWKWERFHDLGAMGIVGDLPSHINEDVRFENENKLDISIEFADYLISNALDGASGEVLEKLKSVLKNLDEITFRDVLETNNLILLALKSENGSISLAFDSKYPFKFKSGESFKND